MRLTQGTFSFLADLDDTQIEKQIKYAMSNGWAMNVEYTDDPHPRNNYWDLWGLPLFDIRDSEAVFYEYRQARMALADSYYIRINAFNSNYGVESCALSFIVDRPINEPGFYLERQETFGRHINYTISSYAVQNNKEGERYGFDKGF